jgi:hypothetical protein
LVVWQKKIKFQLKFQNRFLFNFSHFTRVIWPNFSKFKTKCFQIFLVAQTFFFSAWGCQIY